MVRAEFLTLMLASLCTLAGGCGGPADDQPGDDIADLPVPIAGAGSDESVSVGELRRGLGIGDAGDFRKIGGEIRLASLASTNVADLSPMAGLPLRELDISDTRVSDLAPLAGMPLEVLYAERTRVSDLSPLAGLPLRVLYLIDTPVTDATPLAGMSLEQLNLVGTQVADLEWCRAIPSIGILWLRSTPVTDLTPLKDVAMTSLDVQDTSVADLGPLSEKQDLRRLNIAGTTVTDLWPLTELQLSRLVFTPSKIETGIEAVRNMSSLMELGTQFEVDRDAIPAAEFWRRYDAGEFAEPETTSEPEGANSEPGE